MPSESYKRIKQLANDKIEKIANSTLNNVKSENYINPILFIVILAILLILIINLF